MRLYDYDASGNCFKVRLLLRLTGVQCELVPTDIFAGDTLTEAFGRLNPFRETPVLELDDGRPLTQSAVILSYLAEGTPYLPADTFQRAQAHSWLHFEQERVIPGIAGVRFRVITGRWAPDGPEVTERAAGARQALDVMNDHVATRDWFVGAGPSIADIGLFAYVSRAGEAGLDLTHWPAVGAWLDRVRSIEGFHDDFAPYPDNAARFDGRSIYG